MKKITVLGGGTGSYVVLSGLKQDDSLDLAAIVTMSDNGGSTGRLRDQLGVLPAGDLRQCLVALSNASQVWRKLFTYRFESGDLTGHNFGNILISALEKVSDNYDDVLDEAHRLMNVKGRVIPVTSDNVNIHILYESGRKLEGEKLLDEANSDGSRIREATLVPPAPARQEALDRIADSDVIIMGPGDLYSSIISIALSGGVPDAIRNSPARLIFITNLMTKSSQTKDYTAGDHVRDITRYFGRQPDAVILNTGHIPDEFLNAYEQVGDAVVTDDLDDGRFSGIIVRRDLVSDAVYNDRKELLASTFAHSIVRHDPAKLAQVLAELIHD